MKKNTRKKDRKTKRQDCKKKRTQEKSAKKDSYRCKRHKDKIQNRNMFLLSLNTNFFTLVLVFSMSHCFYI